MRNAIFAIFIMTLTIGFKVIADDEIQALTVSEFAEAEEASGSTFRGSTSVEGSTLSNPSLLILGGVGNTPPWSQCIAQVVTAESTRHQRLQVTEVRGPISVKKEEMQKALEGVTQGIQSPDLRYYLWTQGPTDPKTGEPLNHVMIVFETLDSNQAWTVQTPNPRDLENNPALLDKLMSRQQGHGHSFDFLAPTFTTSSMSSKARVILYQGEKFKADLFTGKSNYNYKDLFTVDVSKCF